MDRKNKILEIFKESNITIISENRLIEYIDFCIARDQETHTVYKTSHHHILPQADKMGFGEYSNLNKYKWNGTHLSHYDHYYAHFMLTECIDCISTLFAFTQMHGMDFANKRITKEELIDESVYNSIWERLIADRTNEFVDSNGNLTSKAKESAKMSVNTRKPIQKKINEKISKLALTEYVNEYGELTTVAKERAIKVSKTLMNEYIDKNGEVTTIAKVAGKKLSKTLNNKIIDSQGNETTLGKQRSLIVAKIMSTEYIDDEGNTTTIYKEGSKKMSKRCSTEYINDDGELTTIFKENGKKISAARRKNGRKYRVLNVFDSSIDMQLTNAEVVNISTELHKKTKDSYLGMNPSGATSMRKKDRGHNIGLYVEQILD